MTSVLSQLRALLNSGELSATAPASAYPLLPPVKPPSCVVRPGDADELQAIVRHANQAGLNLAVTSSSEPHVKGGITSQAEHVLLDLSHWRNIDLIDRRNRVCRVQPGVTCGQLRAALKEHGLTVPLPLAPRAGKSALAAVLDREPSTWPNKQWDSGDPLGSSEFFFGNGERFRTGAAGGPGTIQQQRQSGGALKYPSGPSQTGFHRVVQGAQGTLGIVTWITLRAELLPSVQQAFLLGADQFEELTPFVYAVQRGLLGEESFILDRTALALLMAGGDQGAFDALPAYVCLQNVAGLERLPQERLDFHLQDIGRFARQFNLRLEPSIGPVSAAELLARATSPCGESDWRHALRGHCLSIFFLSTLDRVPEFQRVFQDAAADFDVPAQEVGLYVQPIVQNHGCHVEFMLPFDPEQAQRMRELEKQAVARLMEAGAFFSRPYGAAAELVWAQNPANYQLVKTVKGIFDPKRVLQRGKWGL